MKRLLIFITLVGCYSAWAVPTVVQTTTCTSTPGGTAVCTFTSSVTAGNLLVMMTADFGGEAATDCVTNVNASFSDTLGTTFTCIAGVVNPTGFAAGSAQLFGVATGTGADAITYSPTGPTVRVAALAVEISGVTAPLVDNTATVIAGHPVTFGIGPKTSTTSNAVLFCAGSNNNSVLFSAGSPGTFVSVNNGSNSVTGGFTYSFVGSGSQTCSFTLAATGSQVAGTLGILKVTSPSIVKRRPSQVY